jgi:hypothetical protein
VFWNIGANVGVFSPYSAFCLAFNTSPRLDKLFLSSAEFGSSLHTFSKSNDLNEKPRVEEPKQGMIRFSIDIFIEQFESLFPSHIKIDVDGIEKQIIEGARSTLADERMKFILIELNT